MSTYHIDTQPISWAENYDARIVERDKTNSHLGVDNRVFEEAKALGYAFVMMIRYPGEDEMEAFAPSPRMAPPMELNPDQMEGYIKGCPYCMFEGKVYRYGAGE